MSDGKKGRFNVTKFYEVLISLLQKDNTFFVGEKEIGSERSTRFYKVTVYHQGFLSKNLKICNLQLFIFLTYYLDQIYISSLLALEYSDFFLISFVVRW